MDDTVIIVQFGKMGVFDKKYCKCRAEELIEVVDIYPHSRINTPYWRNIPNYTRISYTMLI
jgi:hypothetical protein